MSINNQALDILHDVISGRREAWDVLFGLKEGKDLCDEAARRLPDEAAARQVILCGPLPF
jgi:hypothetical protein